MAQPISNLILYNCKLDRAGRKTVDFVDRSARDTYFSTTNDIAAIVSIPFSGDATFIRENKTIKIGVNSDILDNNGVNYCRFNNPQSGVNNYYYCFIDEIEYTALNTSILHIRTDVMLTNMGNINTSSCMIQKLSNSTEFKADNGGGLYPTNVLNNIGYSNAICHSSTPIITVGEYDGQNSGSAWVLFACSEPLTLSEKIPDSTPGDTTNGIPTIYYWYAVDPTQAQLFFYTASQNGETGKIIMAYYVPRSLIITYGSFAYVYGSGASSDVYFCRPSTSNDIKTVLTKTVNSFTMPNGYTPKDQNLLRYPYCYACITDRRGHSLILKPELLGTDENGNIIVNYSYLSALGDSCGVGLTVNNYMGAITDESIISLTDFPTLPVVSDPYYQYMALNKNSISNMYVQNAVSALTGFVSNTLNAGGAASPFTASYNIATGLYSASTAISNETAKQNDLMNYPNSVKGGSTNNIAFCSNQRGLYFELWSIPYNAAVEIDRMFECSGDVVSIAANPTNRMKLYDVIQTVDSNVYGAIPKNDKNEIDNIYNSGVTIWHISNGGIYNFYDLDGNEKLT